MPCHALIRSVNSVINAMNIRHVLFCLSVSVVYYQKLLFQQKVKQGIGLVDLRMAPHNFANKGQA